MKVRSLYVTGLLSLVIGIILILAYRNISSSGIITTGGILFILVGLLNLLVFKSRHRNDTSRSALASVVSTITSVGAIILGAFLLIFNSTFATVVPFVFAVFIALLALDQFFVLTVSGNRLYLSPWFLLAPLALTGCAIYLFIGDFSQQGEERLILCTGIATTFFGVVSVIEGLVVGQKSPRDTAPADNREAADKPAPQPKALDNPGEN